MSTPDDDRRPDDGRGDERGSEHDADLDPERLVCGNGSEELLDIVGRMFVRQGDQIVMSQSGFFQFAVVAATAPALGSSDAWRGVSCTTLTAGRPEDVSMSSDRLEDVFARIERRVSDGLFPGATALVARQGVVVGHRAFGTKVAGADEPVALDTIFDLQSMTKVLSTAASALALVQAHPTGAVICTLRRPPSAPISIDFGLMS